MAAILADSNSLSMVISPTLDFSRAISSSGVGAGEINAEDRVHYANCMSFVHLSPSAGKNFGPHVTVGVGTEAALDAMLAEPFEPFAFSAVGASVYQLGTFGTARKELLALTTAP